MVVLESCGNVSGRAPRPEHADSFSGLKCFDGIHVNERKVDGTVGGRIDDDQAVLAERRTFGMAGLMYLPVGHAQNEWLKGLAVQPFADGYHWHGDHFSGCRIELLDAA